MPPGWDELHFQVPHEWKVWLGEAARKRGMSVADLVRQAIRNLMLTRHEQ